MIYIPLVVLIAVVFWRAGWRKGLEITGVAAVICLLFGGLNFSVNVRELPGNLWTVLRGIIYFPVYVVRHPADVLYLLLPCAIGAAAYAAFLALRKWWKLPATRK